MDYTHILNELNKASFFDLFRLSVAIRQQMDNPQRIAEVKSHLKPGMVITYFNDDENRLIPATILKLDRTYVLVQHQDASIRWKIRYYMINLENVDTDIKAPDRKKLDRTHLKVGDLVGFKDRQNQDLYGRITKLNPKTASVLVGENQRWKVYYEYLFEVVEGEVTSAPKMIN